jgi:D-arabinose 1-dehydrogenase-like Zn-dependent alcohol dehydrogenase
MVNANLQAGDNVLITGIGGGIALLAVQLCIAKGANVYVTSGSEDKIKKAMEFGAKGGVIYKSSQ